ncbi:carboxypeptidase regulatory-like domain-containing protein [Chloracidobacterium validum]|uniref:Carboxypeptidase regulatory-like domain-containing protein n=1 Tax=Chloracidobacterium validum TaxID=2821543 RepID=A0ABX8B9L4_9BACT|nr:carboxypeptidase-like regulatory domain-containing protein [Chloracidobacterium validum]QUW02338.1 carboxypeptidase regulatory-like domain-containing protein [Chloracidobacterium validum]
MIRLQWVCPPSWAASFTLVLSLLVMSLGTFGQTTNGRFVVTVKDPSGAVVAGANVSVTNEGTKQTITGTTTESGVFTTSPLPVGSYSITIEADGFTKSIIENLNLNVGQEYGVAAVLQVGGASDVVTISGGEALLQTTNAEVRNTVNARQTQELPLITRSPLALVQLQAGVNGRLANTNTVINGQRSSTTVVTQDGINIQDNFIRANAIDFSPNNPTVAGVGEATIITSNATADVAGSSAVRFVTPAGTDEFHGEVFWFHRNKVLNANAFFNNAAGIARPNFIRNQFGFTLGGPVGIPGGPRVKNLFFFATFEGIRQRSQAGLTTTVLTPNARQGIFTYIDNAGVRRTIDLLALRGISIDPTIASFIARVPN